MTQQDLAQVRSRIIELDYEITSAIIGGHNPTADDRFKQHREELNLLRCLYFGYKSNFCQIKKGFHGTLFS